MIDLVIVTFIILAVMII